MSDASLTADDRNPVDLLADEFAERLRNGESPSMQEYIDRYPQHASEIQELFPGVALLEQLSRRQESETSNRTQSPQHSLPAGHRFGDIEIIRELGRGGMGIVYEAYQHSLSRAVAVKAIHTGSVHSANQAARFQREAQAAAQLHHTNIVPVFGVGEQDGTSYYVMQLIHGQGLDAVLSELSRKVRTPGGRAATNADRDEDVTASMDSFSARELADILVSGRLSESTVRTTAARSHRDRDATVPFHQPVPLAGATSSPNGTGGSASKLEYRQENRTEDRTADVAASETPLQGVRSSLELRDDVAPRSEVRSSLVLRDLSLAGGTKSFPAGAKNPTSVASVDPALQQLGLRYWRNIARIGVQVATGLQYAHSQGTLHRDIKPANILLDTEGTAWIADFGLAKVLQQEDVTRTGDVVGTLRYMAPEQFRGETDGRSDLYSLGLTLYELLTLRPAYEETDRQQLIAQKLTPHDPPHPRKLHPAIPRDLETIVLKCLAWEPDRRYPTAGALVTDLQAFLDDRPIHARRISTAERFWRWCRRNPVIAGLSTAVAMLLLMHASLMTYGYFREKDRAETEAALSAQAQRSATESEQTVDVLWDALNRIYEKSVPDRFAGPVEASSDSEDETNLDSSESTAPVLSTQTAAMLEEMLVTFDQIAKIRGEDVRYLEETATANRKVGDLRLRLGQYAEAGDAFGRAIEKYNRLQEVRGSDTATAVHLARVHNGLGITHQHRGEPFEAWQALGNSLAILNSPEIDKSQPDVRRETAATYYLLSRWSGWSRRPPPGPPPPRRRGPDQNEDSSRGEGPASGVSGDREQPERSGPRSPEVMAETPPSSEPGDADPATAQITAVVQNGVSGDRPPAPAMPFAINAAAVRNDANSRPEREGERGGWRGGRSERRGPGPDPRNNYRNLQRAVAILEPLIAEYPTAPEYRFLNALCHIELSHPFIRPKGVSGEESLDRAIEILADLVKQKPDEPDYLYQLSEAHEQRYYRWKHGFGPLFQKQYSPAEGPTEWQTDMTKIDAAERDLQQAVMLSSSLMRQQPNVARYAEANRSLLFDLADVKAVQGKTEDARRLLVEWNQVQQMVRARFPNEENSNRFEFRRTQHDMLEAELLLQSSQGEKAVELLQQVLERMPASESESRSFFDHIRRGTQATVYSMLATAHDQLGQSESANDARHQAEVLRRDPRDRFESSSSDPPRGATN